MVLPAAESYPSLLIGTAAATRLVEALRKGHGPRHFAAKDILRAAGLPSLPAMTPRSPPISRRSSWAGSCPLCSWSRGSRCGSLAATTVCARAVTSMRRLCPRGKARPHGESRPALGTFAPGRASVQCGHSIHDD